MRVVIRMGDTGIERNRCKWLGGWINMFLPYLTDDLEFYLKVPYMG